MWRLKRRRGLRKHKIKNMETLATENICVPKNNHIIPHNVAYSYGASNAGAGSDISQMGTNSEQFRTKIHP